MQVDSAGNGCLCCLVCSVLLLQALICCGAESGIGSGIYIDDGSGASGSGEEGSSYQHETPTNSPATNGTGPGSLGQPM